MLPYRHTQPGTVIRWCMALGLLPATLIPALCTLPPAVRGLPALVPVLLLVTLILFWSQTTEVTQAHFKFWFGPGLIHKAIPITDLERFEPVDGVFSWGIHWSGSTGWLYNVSGRKAVAMVLRNGKRLMVGTDEPEALCRALEESRQGFEKA